MNLMYAHHYSSLTLRRTRIAGTLLQLATVTGSLILFTGCASGRVAGLPRGEWTGKGAFTFERWGEPEKTESIHRDYCTRLSIKTTSVDGQPATQLEIISERGDLPELGPRTHMRLALVEVKRLDDDAILYRVAGPIFDPKPDDQPKFEKDAPPVGASCMNVNGNTVLQIAYHQGFVDTFRFRGKGLTKAGSLTVEDGSIHWAETLVQRKPVDIMAAPISY